MSLIGGPTDASILQAAQAQQAAAKARDRERAAAERKRRQEDQVELRVDEVEHLDAVRSLPQSDSEQAEDESRRRPREDDRRQIVLQA